MKDYSKNDRYMKSMGMKGGKVMKNHGNTTSIQPDAQKYDMGRVQKLGMNPKGYNSKAFDYKY